MGLPCFSSFLACLKRDVILFRASYHALTISIGAVMSWLASSLIATAVRIRCSQSAGSEKSTYTFTTPPKNDLQKATTIFQNSLFLKRFFFRGILVAGIRFLSIEGNGSKIILELPDLNEWATVDVFLKFSNAVSCAKAERECNPDIRFLILPYKSGAAALFRKRA
jgi:hypothetical protein